MTDLQIFAVAIGIGWLFTVFVVLFLLWKCENLQKRCDCLGKESDMLLGLCKNHNRRLLLLEANSDIIIHYNKNLGEKL